MAFHRHDFLRLVLERVDAVHVAGDDLDRRDDCRHPHCHGEHLSCVQVGAVAQQMPGADPADDEGSREVGGSHRVDQAIGEAGIEDDLEPAVTRQILPVGADLVPHRRLHPAVDRQDPESGHEGPHRDHQRGGEMELLADAVHAEQHDAEEPGLEEEGGQDLIGHQRADDGAGNVGEDRPVGAELGAHHDARDDAHGEGDGKDLQPVFEQVEI